MAARARINDKTEVIVSQNPHHVISERSQAAAIVFLGFEMPDQNGEAGFYQQIELLSKDLPRSLLVNSTGDMTLDS